MASASVAEKMLIGVILPTDKEKVDKLSLDQVVTKFLHILGQVFFSFFSSTLIFIFFVKSRHLWKLVCSRGRVL